MFTQKDLSFIDRGKFTVLESGAMAVTLRSRSTGHYWHIVYEENAGKGSCRIYHRHHEAAPYHYHGHAKTLGSAVRKILSHDEFQLGGRKYS